ncbi:MAG: hypothetical protein HY927_14840 [Elusimicrobia bacterium]|nr:hypothetical protein [Elusimicrobiota bacterium]
MAAPGFWSNAFAVDSREPLTADELRWLDAIAEQLVRRGLERPAILFLESSKPLQFVAGQAARFLDPIFSLVVPQSALERLADLLEKRQAAERLIEKLEIHEHAPRS